MGVGLVCLRVGVVGSGEGEVGVGLVCLRVGVVGSGEGGEDDASRGGRVG